MGVNFLSSAFLAQLSHVLAGCAAAALFFLLVPLAWVPVALIALEWTVLVKEGAVDPLVEPGQPFFWEGVRDWAFWQPGVLLTAGLLLLAHRPI